MCVRVLRLAGWVLKLRVATGLRGIELSRAGVYRGVGGCLSKTCLAAVSLLKRELRGFCACVSVHLQLCMEVFWSFSQLQLEQRPGPAPLPLFSAASRDNGARMGRDVAKGKEGGGEMEPSPGNG